MTTDTETDLTADSGDSIITDPVALDSAKELLADIEKIPTLPAVPMKILGLVDDPNSSVKELQRFISMDQSLTARILKISNSAYYGFSRQISTVSQAVVILGFSAVKSLALSASVVHIFKPDAGKFNLFEFWKHSIFTGGIANVIANKIRYPLPEECLAAGIIHGMGKLIMDQYLHDRFMRAIAMAEKDNRDLLECEREVMKMDHCQLGALLAERWKLPPQLVESIRYYNNPAGATLNPSLVSLVHIGNHIASDKKFGDSGEIGLKRKLSSDARKILNLSQVELMQITHNVDDEIAKYQELVKAILD